jgi:hypothetical protein
MFESDDGDFTIYKRDRPGFLTFYLDSGEYEDLKKEYGPAFDTKFMKHSLMSSSNKMGCVLSNLEPLVAGGSPWWEIVAGGSPWWEILMLTALRYAERAVICVLPDGFRLPARVIDEASARGKRLACARLSSFTQDERLRLGMVFMAMRPRRRPGDANDISRIEHAMELLGTASMSASTSARPGSGGRPAASRQPAAWPGGGTIEDPRRSPPPPGGSPWRPPSTPRPGSSRT